MKNQQLQKDLEAFQKQLKLALPQIINQAKKDICHSQYFESLFKESKPNNIQELYSQSLLRLDPHISRQQPQLEDDIQIINDFIHIYFETHFSTLQKMMLLEKEVKTQMELEDIQTIAIKESKQQFQYLTQLEVDQNKVLEYDTANMKEICLILKKKYYKIPTQPICDNCFCGNQLHYNQVVQCQLCDKYYHVKCLDKSYDERYVNNFTCPRCTLYNMDQFCEVISTLVDPCPFKKNGLTNSKLVRFKTDCEMVDIRCIRLDSPQAAQEITWPDLGEIQLNGKKVFDFVPLSQQSCLHKRKDEKLLCSIPKNEECTLIFKETIPGIDQKRKFRIIDEQLYYFAIYKTKQYTAKQLIDKIIDNPQNWMSLEQSRDFVILQINYSPAIKIIKLHISLLCCFSSSLMLTPVRGIYCTHVQCFSLESYILMLDQQLPRKWRCPICKAKIFKLQIDALQYTILKSIRQLGLQEKYSCISFDFQGNILDEVISKSIDFNNIPENAKQNYNRIPQLEKLSSSNIDNEDFEIQSNSKLNNHKSIVIIQSRDSSFQQIYNQYFSYKYQLQIRIQNELYRLLNIIRYIIQITFITFNQSKTTIQQFLIKKWLQYNNKSIIIIQLFKKLNNLYLFNSLIFLNNIIIMINQEFYDNALKTLQQLSPEIQEYQFPHLRLFTDGDEFYQKLWQMIDESKTYCWILTYAMDKSLAANITLYKLINAQQRGVNVVLFVDDLQGHYNNKLTKLLQSYGGVFLNLNPLSAFKIYGQEFFRRHHEKMAVADHKAIFGTSNIESHYGGVKWGKQTFHDINTYTEGRHLSYNLQKHFMYLASLYKIQLNPHKPTPNEDLLYTFNAFPPYYEFFKTHPPFNRQIQTQIIESIKNAKDNIKIVQAYYYSVRIFEKHLREAMDRGVKVEIITADKRDQPVYRYAFNRILFQGVIHRNLKVYEFPEQLLHMKGYVFDNKQLFYGSFNNDRWSWKLNHEFNILTEDENEIKMFMDIYNETKLRTRQIDYKKTGTPLRWIKMKFWEWFIYQSEILMSKNQGYHPNKYKYNYLLNTWDDGIGNYF